MPLINVILDVDSIQPPLTGIGRYVCELARGLAASQEIGDLRLIKRHRFVNDLDALVGSSSAQGAPMSPDSAGTPSKESGFFIAKRTIGRMVLPGVKYWRTRSLKSHIYHSPNYALPPFPGKRVSTIHDLSVLRYPEFHPKERVDHLLRLFPRILRRADLFLTDSHFTKAELIEVCGVAEDRVKCVNLGVDPQFRLHATDELEAGLRPYGLRPQGFALHVGTIEPRKNLDRLIEAYANLPIDLRELYPLVLVGSHGWLSDQIHALMRDKALEGWLQYLRFVPESDLPILYAGARLVVYPSLYEGFGLPVLEAMASGTPVICSNIASLPEVGGEAVRYIDPFNAEALSSAIQELLLGDAERARLRMAGLRQAEKFSWAATVAATVDAYRLI